MIWGENFSQPVPRRTLLNVSILIAHLAGVLGFYVVLVVGRSRFMAFFLIMLFSLITFDTYYFKNSFSQLIPQLNQQYREVLCDSRLPIILALVTLSIFLLFGQRLVLLLLIALAITLGIGVVNNSSTSQGRAIGIGVIASMSLLLIISESLKGALYVGSGDSLVHLNIIDTIIQTGDTEGAAQSRLMPYLLFHIYISGVTQLFGLAVPETASLILAIAFQVVVLYVYLITSRESNPTAGAVAAALLGTLPPVVYAGSLVHYRSWSFVYLGLFIYFITSKRNHQRFGGVLVVVSVIWVFTHHVSIVFAGSFLTAIAIGGMLSKQNRRPFLFLIVLFVIFFHRYVVLTDGLKTLITWIFFTSPSAEGVTSGGYQVVYNGDILSLIKSSLPTFLNYIYYIPLIGIGGYGLAQVLTMRTERIDLRFLAPVSIISIIIFIPNPVWIPMEGLAEIPRWHLISAPFVVIPLGIGISAAIPQSSASEISPASVLMLFTVIALLVVSAPMNGGLENTAGYEKQPQRFFTNEEVKMMDFAIAHISDRSVYGYSKVPTYIEKNSPSADHIQARRIEVPADGKTIRPADGYTLFSKRTFERSAIALSGCREVNGESVCIFTVVSNSEYKTDFDTSSIVYTNGGAEIIEK